MRSRRLGSMYRFLSLVHKPDRLASWMVVRR